MTAAKILDALQCQRGNCPCHASARAGKGPTHCPSHPDANPSLSITPPDRSPNPLVRCFAGCSYEAITAVLRERGLWPTVTAYRMNGATHTRTDTPTGKRVIWTPGAKSREMLYPDGWADGLTPGAIVLLTEGEKACDAALSRGLAAVATVCGASTIPTTETLRPLAAFDAVLLPDNDDASVKFIGQKHMQNIGRELVALGGKPRWLELPDLPPKGDLADYVGADEHLLRLIAAAPVWVAEVDAEATPGRFRLHTRAEFLDSPDPTWLVDGMVPKPGAALLYSPSGLGKSFVALDLACSVATGLPWLGRDVVRGDVVYIAAEGQAGFKKRLQAWEDAHDARADRVFWITAAPQFMGDDADAVLAEMLLSGITPALIIVDTLSRTLVGGDENSARDVGLYLASMERLKAATGACTMVVHHTGHNAQDRPRGSSTIMPAVDLLLALTGERETHNLVLTCEKQKDAAEFEPIALRLVQFDDSLIVELSNEDTATNGLPKPAQEALNALCDVGDDDVSTSVWMKLLPGMNERTFYRAKSVLVSRFLVQNVGSQTRPRWKTDILTKTDKADMSPSGCDTDILTRPVGVSVLSVSPRQAELSPNETPSSWAYDPAECSDCGGRADARALRDGLCLACAPAVPA